MLWNENSIDLLKTLLHDILDLPQKTIEDAIATGNPNALRAKVLSKTIGFEIDEVDEICHILTTEG